MNVCLRVQISPIRSNESAPPSSPSATEQPPFNTHIAPNWSDFSCCCRCSCAICVPFSSSSLALALAYHHHHHHHHNELQTFPPPKNSNYHQTSSALITILVLLPPIRSPVFRSNPNLRTPQTCNYVSLMKWAFVARYFGANFKFQTTTLSIWKYYLYPIREAKIEIRAGIVLFYVF